jgi:hypothetical protein
MKIVIATALLLSVATLCLCGRPQQPANPIVAMVTMPFENCRIYAAPPDPPVDSTSGCLNSFYGMWLQSVGIRIVPLPWNAAANDKRALLDQVNGVFLPGGDLEGKAWAEFYAAMQPVYDYAIERTSRHDKFWVWGTCQGFQVLATLAARDPSILQCVYHGVESAMLPLHFTEYGASQSIMFGGDAQARQLYATKNVTLNLHHCGITPEDWQRNPQLNASLRIVSTNIDAAGRPFVSAFEGVPGLPNTENFFGVQFHPERAQFHFVTDKWGHSDDDIEAALYLAKFARRRLQLNNHRFSSPEAASAQQLEAYPSSYRGYGAVWHWIPLGAQQGAGLPHTIAVATAATDSVLINVSGDVILGLVVGLGLMAIGVFAARMMLSIG